MILDIENEFIRPDILENLHTEAYTETFNLIDLFYNTCKISQLENSKSKHYWVCDSSPGHGKTTALMTRVKQIIKRNEITPLLLVFVNIDAMMVFYKEVKDYEKSIDRVDMIQYVDADNHEFVSDTLTEYRIVCITQQRLRDLAIGIGNLESYLNFDSYSNGMLKRSMIIDEKPILTNDCDFDVSSKDNCVDWLDAMASTSNLTPEEKSRVRVDIMSLIVEELANNKTNSTLRLDRSIERTEAGEFLINILARLNKSACSREHFLKYQWFIKLLKNDNVGHIDRHYDGSRIICSEHISYTNLSNNILILDGTSGYTTLLYNGEYEYKLVTNYHDYANRLQIHIRIINTSATSRRRMDKKVQNTITADIKQLREKGFNPFPLMGKSDIKYYKDSGVINVEQLEFFDEKPVENSDADMPLNLLNTVGKNVLNSYESLALLNLPIRHPSYFKKLAIGLLGAEVNLSFAGRNIDRWFEDVNVDAIYKQCLLADIVQIIHRCKIRNLNDTSLVHIFIYTNRLEWANIFKNIFTLPNSNVDQHKLIDNDHEEFLSKCIRRSIEVKEYLTENDLPEHPFGKGFYPKQVSGRPFKEWLIENWSNESRKIEIKRIFDEAGIYIEDKKSGKKFWLKEYRNIAI